MKLKSLATIAAAGAITAATLVTGAGTASAVTYNIGGSCFKSANDLSTRYFVNANAMPVSGGSVGEPATFQGFDVNIVYTPQQGSPAGGYRPTGPTQTITTFVRSIGPNTICVTIDPAYPVAFGNFTYNGPL